MSTPDGELTLIFNGEIYNYVELRSELQAQGHSFRTSSDTEVLLVALRHWGEDALVRLNGMFAFALWDSRRRQILLARDRFGEKPLFIGRGELGTVVFASEMKAILPHPAMKVAVSDAALRRYANSGWHEDDEQTFFEGIERLPPSHALWIDEDGREVRRWRYWIPSYNEISDISPRDAVERFTELLQRSLDLRLRADVPIGSSLSGGLDSSVVVGLLSQKRAVSSFTQNTFSACYAHDPTMSEEREIDAVVEHTRVKSFRVEPDPARLIEESRLLHWHQEEPFLSASIYMQWCVARLAHQSGTTVLLDGQGADELLAGYQFYFRQHQLDLIDRGRLPVARRETRKFTRRLRLASEQFEEPGRRFDANIALPEESLASLAASPPPPSPSIYTSAIVPAGPGNRLRKILSEALNFNSLPMLLRYADRNAMAFSREARMPYLDYDLVDFCLRLPDHYYIRNGWQKWILRMAAGSAIPSAIRWRADKVGYAAPLDNWLRKELKSWALERLMDRRLRSVPGYSASLVTHQWKDHQAGRSNHSWALWRWISLVEWFELRDCGWWRSVDASGLFSSRDRILPSSVGAEGTVSVIGSAPTVELNNVPDLTTVS